MCVCSCVRQKIITNVGGQLIKNCTPKRNRESETPPTNHYHIVAVANHTRFYIWPQFIHWLMTVHRITTVVWAGLCFGAGGKNELYLSICYNKRLMRNDDILQMMYLCVCFFWTCWISLACPFFVRIYAHINTICYPVSHVLSHYYI